MASKPGSWWSKDTIAVVTGANKGIGYEIVRCLSKEGVTVVLTARDVDRGQSALNSLKAEGLESIVFHQLDITDSESVEKLAAWLKKEYGRIDILVNNAGVESGGTRANFDSLTKTINTNYYGTKKVTEALLPLLRPSPTGSRIINVSSRLGLYARFEGESLKEKFKDEDNYSVEFIDTMAAKFLEDARAGQQYKAGWISQNRTPGYSESKIFLHGYTISLAKSLAKSQAEDHRVFVVSFCPGVTQTDMLVTGMEGGLCVPEGYFVKTVEAGADTGVWLALLPKSELLDKNGKLFAEKEEFPYSTVVPF